MQKLKLFGLFAALAVVLVACPPTPPVTPPPPPPPTTPPAPPSPPAPPPSTAITIQGTLEKYTRGAHTLKFQVLSPGPSYTQTNIAQGQLATDGSFQITLPEESKLSGLLRPFSICPGVNAPSDLQTTSGGSLIAFSNGPNPTGYLGQATQAPINGVNLPSGTVQTIYVYADRDANVTGTCGSTVYDMAFKKGWNLIAAEFGQNSITRATTNPPANLKWFYVPTGGTVNVTAPATKLEIGKSYNFTATAQDSDGQPLTGTFTWTSSDPTNMPVSADGVVTPKGFTGGVTISAYLNGASGAIQNVQSYGLQIAGGTYNTGSASLGTAFFMRYVDETGVAPTTDRSFTMTGPSGWNGGAGLSVTYPANATSAWVARGDILPVTGNYAFTTTAPAISSLRAQGLGTTTQSVMPARSSIMSLSPIPFTPGKVVPSSTAISVTGTGFAIDATQSLGQATNITIGDYNGNYTTSSVTGNWTAPSVTPNYSQNSFEARVVNPTTGEVLGKQVGGFYGSGPSSATINSLSLDNASSYEWRVLAFNTDVVSAYNYGAPAQFNISRASKTFDFKPTITGLGFGGATMLGGMELMINGRQFQNDIKVKFGDVEASARVINANSLGVIVPARKAGGIVDISVTTPAGSSPSNAATKFEYLPVTEYALTNTPILAAGPDDNVWFAETGGYSGVTTIGRIVPSSVIPITRFDITTPTNSTAYIQDLSAGPGNTIWFAEGGYNAKRIGKLNAADGKGLAWYALDKTVGGAAALTTGPDNRIWFLESGGSNIGRIDADGKNLVLFPVPLGGSTFSNALDIKLGPDGNVWFSAPSGGLGKITPSGAVTVYSTTVANGSSSSPSGLTSGPNNLMWFTNGSVYSTGASLGSIDASGTVTLVNPSGNPNSTVGTGQRLASDSSGNLWFGILNGIAGNAPYLLGRFKPGTAYTPLAVASPASSGCCSLGVNDVVFVGGRVWYARQGNTVGFITP
jgi:virginiamycin B lyase